MTCASEGGDPYSLIERSIQTAETLISEKTPIPQRRVDRRRGIILSLLFYFKLKSETLAELHRSVCEILG